MLEQNGNYKMALTTAKKELVEKKQRACFQNARIKTYEIVIIVNKAWKHSFSRVEYNKKAFAVGGLCPLTRNLLDHPEVAAAKVQSSDNEARVKVQLLHLTISKVWLLR